MKVTIQKYRGERAGSGTGAMTYREAALASERDAIDITHMLITTPKVSEEVTYGLFGYEISDITISIDITLINRREQLFDFLRRADYESYAYTLDDVACAEYLSSNDEIFVIRFYLVDGASPLNYDYSYYFRWRDVDTNYKTMRAQIKARHILGLLDDTLDAITYGAGLSGKWDVESFLSYLQTIRPLLS